MYISKSNFKKTSLRTLMSTIRFNWQKNINFTGSKTGHWSSSRSTSRHSKCNNCCFFYFVHPTYPTITIHCFYNLFLLLFLVQFGLTNFVSKNFNFLFFHRFCNIFFFFSWYGFLFLTAGLSLFYFFYLFVNM